MRAPTRRQGCANELLHGKSQGRLWTADADGKEAQGDYGPLVDRDESSMFCGFGTGHHTRGAARHGHNEREQRVLVRQFWDVDERRDIAAISRRAAVTSPCRAMLPRPLGCSLTRARSASSDVPTARGTTWHAAPFSSSFSSVMQCSTELQFPAVAQGPRLRGVVNSGISFDAIGIARRRPSGAIFVILVQKAESGRHRAVLNRQYGDLRAYKRNDTAHRSQ